MSVNPNWVINFVSSFVSLLSFCLVILSSGESGVLKSPTIRVCGFVCDLSFSNVSFTNVDAFVFGHKCSELRLHPDGFLL